MMVTILLAIILTASVTGFPQESTKANDTHTSKPIIINFPTSPSISGNATINDFEDDLELKGKEGENFWAKFIRYSWKMTKLMSLMKEEIEVRQGGDRAMGKEELTWINWLSSLDNPSVSAIEVREISDIVKLYASITETQREQFILLLESSTADVFRNATVDLGFLVSLQQGKEYIDQMMSYIGNVPLLRDVRDRYDCIMKSMQYYGLNVLDTFNFLRGIDSLKSEQKNTEEYGTSYLLELLQNGVEWLGYSENTVSAVLPVQPLPPSKPPSNRNKEDKTKPKEVSLYSKYHQHKPRPVYTKQQSPVPNSGKVEGRQGVPAVHDSEYFSRDGFRVVGSQGNSYKIFAPDFIQEETIWDKLWSWFN